MFYGTGIRGSTGGWMGDGIGSCTVRSLDGSLGSNSGRTDRGLATGLGVVEEGYNGGEK